MVAEGVSGITGGTHDRGDAHTQRRSLFVSQIIRDLDLHVSLDHDILRKSAILRLRLVRPMDHPADPIALGKRLGHLAANRLDNAGIVAADADAHAVSLNVLPVGRVEGQGGRADQDVIITELGEGHRLNLGRAGLGDDDGFDLGWGSHG